MISNDHSEAWFLALVDNRLSLLLTHKVYNIGKVTIIRYHMDFENLT